MTDPLAARLSEVAVAAQRTYRTRRGWGAYTTPPVPTGLIDEITAGLAPVLLDLVDAAVAARLAAPNVPPATCKHSITGSGGRLLVCELAPHPDAVAHCAGGTSWRNVPAGHDVHETAGYRPTDLRPGRPA